jgi:hypothetical protein
MKEENSKSLDIFGIKPFADSINEVTKGAVAGASAFLSRICLPAADEFGLLLRDKVSHWRGQNALRIAQKAESKFIVGDNVNLQAHPRIVCETIEKGSWCDDDEIQELWAGLLASACTEDGRDDSNLVFIGMLEQLTAPQVRILNYACEEAPKWKSMAGWPIADEIVIPLEKLITVSKVDDFHRLDRELDHLRAFELIGAGGIFGHGGGFGTDSTDARIRPSALALHLYVRGQGYVGSPVEYWNLNEKKKNEKGEQISGANSVNAAAKASPLTE